MTAPTPSDVRLIQNIEGVLYDVYFPVVQTKEEQDETAKHLKSGFRDLMAKSKVEE